MAQVDFSPEDVERAARYHRPRYAALCLELVLSVSVLALLQWVWLGPWHLVDGLGWAGAAAGYAALVTAIELLSTPVLPPGAVLQERRFAHPERGAVAPTPGGEAASDRPQRLTGRRSGACASFGLPRRRAAAAPRFALISPGAVAEPDLQPLPPARRRLARRSAARASRSAQAFWFATRVADASRRHQGERARVRARRRAGSSSTTRRRRR
jgi:hypothetical protein